MQTEIAIRIECESKTCGNCCYKFQSPWVVAPDYYCTMFEVALIIVAGHTTQRCQECLEAEVRMSGLLDDRELTEMTLDAMVDQL